MMSFLRFFFFTVLSPSPLLIFAGHEAPFFELFQFLKDASVFSAAFSFLRLLCRILFQDSRDCIGILCLKEHRVLWRICFFVFTIAKSTPYLFAIFLKSLIPESPMSILIPRPWPISSFTDCFPFDVFSGHLCDILFFDDDGTRHAGLYSVLP